MERAGNEGEGGEGMDWNKGVEGQDGGHFAARGWKGEGRKGREGTGIKEGEGEDVEQQGGGKGREGRGGKRRE